LSLLACLLPFPKEGLPSLQTVFEEWTRLAVDIRWVYKCSTAFEGELWFKISPCPMAWWRKAGKGQPGVELWEE